MHGEDGGAQGDKDFTFIFAKTLSGVAPGTLGTVNAAQTACFELPLHFLGALKIEATSAMSNGLAFGTAYNSGWGGANATKPPVIMTPEVISGTNVGYDKIYVAGFAGGALDFSTGVKPTAQAATSTDTIAVDGQDPRKCFQIGDTIYTNTDDTALGTIKSMGANEIVLNANLAAQVEDNEEIVNANPMTIKFGFSQ